MTEHDLKEMKNLGAELGAAKAERERLIGLLRTAWRLRPDRSYHEDHLQAEQRAWEVEVAEVLNAADALSQQAESECVACEGHPAACNNPCALCGKQADPTDTYTAVDMATDAAQGFRDGQAAVEQSTAQDERENWNVALLQVAVVLEALRSSDSAARLANMNAGKTLGEAYAKLKDIRATRRGTRPAQTEHQPVGRVFTDEERFRSDGKSGPVWWFGPLPAGAMLYAAPIAQTAPQHLDDAAVDRFAAAMKAKLAKSRAKGRGGWDDPSVCSVEFLAQLLVEHLGKGNAGTFEDVANFAMMLHQRGADPMVLANATRPAQTAPHDALYAPGIAEQLERTDWTPEEALRWYAEGKHFDTVNGRTRIIDSGAIASNALKHLSLPYLEMKGDAELSELRTQTAPQPEQSGLVEALRTEALGLCDVVEKINNLSPVTYALQAGRAINKVRDAAAALSAQWTAEQ